MAHVLCLRPGLVSLEQTCFFRKSSYQKFATIQRFLKTVGYQTMGSIIGGDADLNPVIDKNLYPVFLHPSGKHPCDDHVVIAFNLHRSAAQHSGDDAF